MALEDLSLTHTHTQTHTHKCKQTWMSHIYFWKGIQADRFCPQIDICFKGRGSPDLFLGPRKMGKRETSHNSTILYLEVGSNDLIMGRSFSLLYL